jgi:4-hydroxybenzoate polyprenyltransferase
MEPKADRRIARTAGSPRRALAFFLLFLPTFSFCSWAAAAAALPSGQIPITASNTAIGMHDPKEPGI